MSNNWTVFIADGSRDATGWACVGLWLLGWAATCCALASAARSWQWQSDWLRQVLVMVVLLVCWPYTLARLAAGK